MIKSILLLLESGVNPGLYAQELMETCERFVSDCKGIPLTEPEEVLIRAAAKTKAPGLSTVLVAYFDGQVWTFPENDYFWVYYKESTQKRN